MTSDRRTVVYRLYDAAGRLLYVGIGYNAGPRFGSHSRTAPWWPQVDRADVRWHTNRAEAKAAERTAVRTECPLHNRRLRAEALTRNISTKLSDAEIAAVNAARGTMPVGQWVRLAILAALPADAGTCGQSAS